MQYFHPKHCNYLLRACGHSISISSDNHIILTNDLKDKLSKSDEYKILYKDEVLDLNALTLVDNAISVCFLFNGYLILLNTGDLIYIVSKYNKKKIPTIKKVFDGLHIHNICNNANKIIVYSENNLYLLNMDFSISIYHNVIGYSAKCNIVLILSSDNRVMLISQSKLYRLHACKVHAVNCDDLFNDIIYSEITDIYIYHSEIYIVVSGKVVYWSSCENNCFYTNIKDMVGVKSVIHSKTTYFCMLNDGRLFTYNIEVGMRVYKKVIKYIIISDYLVCFHYDFTTSITNIKIPNQIERLTDLETISLYSFLKNPINIDILNSIDVFIKLYNINSTNALLYKKNNCLELLNIENLELISLNTIFDCGGDAVFLQLYDNSGTFYI